MPTRIPRRIRRLISFARRLAHERTAACVLAALLAIPATQAAAVDPGTQLVAGFARQVQPLLLNKCATGACHGGPSAHVPRFQRGQVSGQIDRADTLANIESLLRVVATPAHVPAFLATISGRHPDTASSEVVRLSPVTSQERVRLERWLVAATGTASPLRPLASPAPSFSSTEASASEPLPEPLPEPPVTSSPAAAASRRPAPANRFRLMLEAAAHPPVLPPPEQPQGIILGKDRGE